MITNFNIELIQTFYPSALIGQNAVSKINKQKLTVSILRFLN